MPSWGAKEVCQIIIRDAYDSLCTKENILGLQTMEPPGLGVEPPRSAHSEYFNRTESMTYIYKQTNTDMEC